MPIGHHNLTLITVQNRSLYTNWLVEFEQYNEKIHFSNELNELFEPAKSYYWLGDLMLTVDLNKLFQKSIQDIMIEFLSDEEQSQIMTTNQQIQSLILQNSYKLDLPIEITSSFTISQIYKKIRFSFFDSVEITPLEKIETLLKSFALTHNEKLLVFTNLTHYFDSKDFDKLNELLSDYDQTALSIEFNQSKSSDDHSDYLIDEDFCLFES
ncbi:hypothetical protein FC86_GL000508 [Holzapfeliella floricola DSM 23037 = JCM 16512]|uniref:Type II-A CRISPR-associated protein Csn2 n=2 Tax=Holzapfeliella TaxID=2767883 RepID=A0A0R2DUU5_9LACO|nr:hypothetical protein FC86_GL000508 [Holzapfeliella floricola DSM 23037 = JCM 16512]